MGLHSRVYKLGRVGILQPATLSAPQTYFVSHPSPFYTMQFQLSAVFATLSIFFAATSATPTYCEAGKTQMCCQNLQEAGNVGYYCASPNAEFPCQSAPALTAMCCDSYDLTPRGVGYTTPCFITIVLMFGFDSIPEATVPLSLSRGPFKTNAMGHE